MYLLLICNEKSQLTSQKIQIFLTAVNKQGKDLKSFFLLSVLLRASSKMKMAQRRSNLKSFKVQVNIRQMFHDQKPNDIGMLVETRKTALKNISKLTLFNKFNEKPESQCF